ncbi:GAF domain-containing sensor histidine kinase [Aquihabitans sp. G128]|uniref:GAF domain-containing sensor histidine kinase n=1 Tax=Aquihabitans sp. G128 TaxID=2849779 RepID=UPI001C24A6B0|nr:GAF domain-containing sensor histidine kinase [Aquihabitans sp. G128]QXC61692.1 GAF domain-containing sensor histidine kinase [Aquihabitans sp. G128]
MAIAPTAASPGARRALGPLDAELGRTSHDQVATFRPAILGIRGGTTAISVALAAPSFANKEWWIVGWCAVVVGYNVFRIVQPLRYIDDTASLVRVIVEVALHVIVVAATGYWDSPFVFALITAVMVAGFARGFAFALRVSIASALCVAIPFLVSHGAGVQDLRTATQWTVELILVALIAGYARRVTGEADRQHTLALDRLGRLADANLLLYSLHRVAQTLPASLDLEEALDTTISRLRDLFDSDGITLLVLDETDGTWVVSRFDGPRPAPSYATSELPTPLAEAISLKHPVMVSELLVDGPGMSVEMASGLYAALPARDSTVGLVALEHRDAHHFRLRDQELLDGFVEPAALAIDNARWFGRLRTVGADEERTRIARDLHDRIGQSLAYLAFELDRIVKADAKGDSVTKQLDHLRSDVRSVVGEVRDTLYDLRTDVTDSQDVTLILQGFLDRVEARSGLETRLDTRVSGRLPLLQERELWRIAQEAVTNVERHAKASRVVVTWQSDGRHAILLVADDGVGFPEGRAGRLDSYGILGMRERAASIGASLDVAGKPGAGTTVRCEIRVV